jgi:hypothetical protein
LSIDEAVDRLPITVVGGTETIRLTAIVIRLDGGLPRSVAAAPFVADHNACGLASAGAGWQTGHRGREGSS